jgi:hypothetical protein
MNYTAFEIIAGQAHICVDCCGIIARGDQYYRTYKYPFGTKGVPVCVKCHCKQVLPPSCPSRFSITGGGCKNDNNNE